MVGNNRESMKKQAPDFDKNDFQTSDPAKYDLVNQFFNFGGGGKAAAPKVNM